MIIQGNFLDIKLVKQMGRQFWQCSHEIFCQKLFKSHYLFFHDDPIYVFAYKNFIYEPSNDHNAICPLEYNVVIKNTEKKNSYLQIPFLHSQKQFVLQQQKLGNLHQVHQEYCPVTIVGDHLHDPLLHLLLIWWPGLKKKNYW